MKFNKVLSVFLLCTSVAYAADYQGRVVDIDGHGIGYATVYPEEDPIAGAATNDQGSRCCLCECSRRAIRLWSCCANNLSHLRRQW